MTTQTAAARLADCNVPSLVKTVECGQTFILSCRKVRKKDQHNFIGQF